MFANDLKMIIDEPTAQRFKEMELFQFAQRFKESIGGNAAETIRFIENNLALNEEQKEDFSNLLMMTNMHPTKRELVNYFRSKGFSYKKITNLTGISNSTIQLYQDEKPTFIPKTYIFADPVQVTLFNSLVRYFELWGNPVHTQGK